MKQNLSLINYEYKIICFESRDLTVTYVGLLQKDFHHFE